VGNRPRGESSHLGVITIIIKERELTEKNASHPMGDERQEEEEGGNGGGNGLNCEELLLHRIRPLYGGKTRNANSQGNFTFTKREIWRVRKERERGVT